MTPSQECLFCGARPRTVMFYCFECWEKLASMYQPRQQAAMKYVEGEGKQDVSVRCESPCHPDAGLRLVMTEPGHFRVECFTCDEPLFFLTATEASGPVTKVSE